LIEEFVISLNIIKFINLFFLVMLFLDKMCSLTLHSKNSIHGSYWQVFKYIKKYIKLKENNLFKWLDILVF